MEFSPSELALKKFLSLISERALSLPSPVLGGDTTEMFLPSDDPLEIVTGEPPNIPPDPLARLLNSSSRSLMEPLRLRPWLRAITR